MRMCFIADGRSPHARNWIHHFVRAGHEIHLITTYRCEDFDRPLASMTTVPLDFSARVRGGIGGPAALTTNGSPALSRLRGNPVWRALARLRDRAAPVSAMMQAAKVRRIVERVDPDLVHAMRITFEGILAAEALKSTPVPLILSVWGNDFTMTAASSPLVTRLARRALARADGLHPDCRRDLNLARELGYRADKPAAVLPGNGGVKVAFFHDGPPDPALAARLDIHEGRPIVLNPRGVKTYVRTENFFRAIPLVLEKRPNVLFLGAMMADNFSAMGWVNRLGIGHAVRLLPYLTHDEMAGLFHRADVTVSPTDHDGTPNTLLEAMACGSFPAASNLESVREWIEDGVNGLLFDQGDPGSIAGAILRALDDEPLRRSAGDFNRRLVAERADYDSVMRQAGLFYDEVIASTRAAVARQGGR